MQIPTLYIVIVAALVSLPTGLGAENGYHEENTALNSEAEEQALPQFGLYFVESRKEKDQCSMLSCPNTYPNLATSFLANSINGSAFEFIQSDNFDYTMQTSFSNAQVESEASDAVNFSIGLSMSLNF